MLTEGHIKQYTENIIRAHRLSLTEMEQAERLAARTSCKGCLYCKSKQRHLEVLQKTYVDLMLLAGSLRPGESTHRSFPKKMFPNTTIYRGFIDDAGEYIDMFGTGHSNFRKEYAIQHGEERAYKMINVHARGVHTQVQFFDRKYPPNKKQYATLRELLIDAEGLLSFRFAYETKHPAL